MVETLQAYASEQAPGHERNRTGFGHPVVAQAKCRPTSPSSKEIKGDFYSSQEVVSYETGLDFQTVLDFYKKEMPVKGWTFSEQDSTEMENLAILLYEKPDTQGHPQCNRQPTQPKHHRSHHHHKPIGWAMKSLDIASIESSFRQDRRLPGAGETIPGRRLPGGLLEAGQPATFSGRRAYRR